jgi:hypothetical protein
MQPNDPLTILDINDQLRITAILQMLIIETPLQRFKTRMIHFDILLSIQLNRIFLRQADRPVFQRSKHSRCDFIVVH